MDQSALQLQGVSMSEADLARAVAVAKPANQKVRDAAQERLRFEDEPVAYLALLNQAR